MQRVLRWVSLVALVGGLTGGSVQAQYGYGGWGGWGARTAGGDEARGMGVFAAGAGRYNVDTAQARSINQQTRMNHNEYMWESQQLRNKAYLKQMAEKRDRINESADTIYKRLHDNPEARDVTSGDALNVVLDELTAPGVYSESVSASKTPITSAMVKDIPFQYAAQAITISLDELTQSPPPDDLLDPRLATERDALKAIVKKARAESEANGKIAPETLAAARQAIKALQQKLTATMPANSDRQSSENYLKALYGLTKMMQEPDIKEWLKELDTVPETTLAHLLAFMQSFNLRFGVANEPRQRAVYNELYPQLVALRDQVLPDKSKLPTPMSTAMTPSDERSRRAQNTFSQMDLGQLSGDAPAPPAPEPGGNP